LAFGQTFYFGVFPLAKLHAYMFWGLEIRLEKPV
jgi:hypothetical protein